jgi:hypothetical protein
MFAFYTLDKKGQDMSTQWQIAANRRNSKLSTGPRTLKGKSRVALNPLKHGLTAEQIVLLPHEDPAQFDAFRKAIWQDLAPQGAFEAELANTIVIYLWRLRRTPMLEAAMYTVSDEEGPTALELMRSLAAATIRAEEEEAREEQREREEQGAGGSAEPELGHERPAEAETPADAASEAPAKLSGPAKLSDLASIVRRLRGNPGSFANLWRHEGALLRSFFRTLHELQRLQAIRAGERVPVPAAVDVDVNINRNGVVNPE